MKPLRTAQLALKSLTIVVELLAELNLPPPRPPWRLQQKALQMSLISGAALEDLVVLLRAIERRANGRIRPSAKAATRLARIGAPPKGLTVGKKGLRRSRSRR